MMAPQGPLTRLYSEFIVTPNRDALHDQAGLHYIGSTGNSFQSADAIINHLKKETTCYTKKEQNILSSIETQNAVVFELSTVIDFTKGGGILLPEMDDNFVAGSTVTLAMVHIVQFEDGVIKQIRQHWDQACLLKQINVIGKSGQNWPIRAGQDQVKIIKSSVNSVAVDDDVFKTSEIPSRAGTKAPGRQLHEIVGGEGEIPPTPKGGVNNGPRRTFFVGQEIDEVNSTPDRKIKVHPDRFKHFELEHNPEKDAETPKPLPPKRISTYSKAGPSWDFADFTTPEKRPAKVSSKQARTLTWSDDEEETSPAQSQQSSRPISRKGLGHQFEFVDETPKKANEPARDTRIRKGSETNFTFSDESPNGQDESAPSITGISMHGDGMGGKKGTTPLWGFEEETPKKSNGIKTTGNGMGGRQGSERAWAFGHEDEDANKYKPIYKTANDGMGGRKGTDRSWRYDEEDDKDRPMKKENFAPRTQSKPTTDFWNF